MSTFQKPATKPNIPVYVPRSSETKVERGGKSKTTKKRRAALADVSNKGGNSRSSNKTNGHPVKREESFRSGSSSIVSASATATTVSLKQVVYKNNSDEDERIDVEEDISQSDEANSADNEGRPRTRSTRSTRAATKKRATSTAKKAEVSTSNKRGRKRTAAPAEDKDEDEVDLTVASSKRTRRRKNRNKHTDEVIVLYDDDSDDANPVDDDDDDEVISLRQPRSKKRRKSTGDLDVVDSATRRTNNKKKTNYYHSDNDENVMTSPESETASSGRGSKSKKTKARKMTNKKPRSAPQVVRERSRNPQPVVAGPACPPGHHEAPLPPGVEDIDLRHYNEPAYCRVYVKDIYSYLRSQQFKYQLDADFLVDKQPDLNAQMRSILIDWLVEVADEYKLLPDTLYLSASYIDRCLNVMPIDRNKLQLLGCACMLLASKYEEIYPPAVDEFVFISDNTYTREEILYMEGKVLNALGFKLTASTAKNFLRRFQRAAHVKSAEKNLCNYLCEITLQELEMVKFTPSLVAASALYLSRLQLYGQEDSPQGSPEVWTNNLKHYTDYSVPELARCVREIHKTQSLASKNNLKAVYEKYSHSTFESVSHMEFADTKTLPSVTAKAINRGGR